MAKKTVCDTSVTGYAGIERGGYLHGIMLCRPTKNSPETLSSTTFWLLYQKCNDRKGFKLTLRLFSFRVLPQGAID